MAKVDWPLIAALNLLAGAGMVNLFVVVFLGVLGYTALYWAIGDAFLPGQPGWYLLLLWASSQVASYLASKASCWSPDSGLCRMPFMMRTTKSIS